MRYASDDGLVVVVVIVVVVVVVVIVVVAVVVVSIVVVVIKIYECGCKLVKLFVIECSSIFYSAAPDCGLASKCNRPLQK